MTTYITRPSGLWRRIEVARRPDCPMVRYVKVPHSESEYTVPMSPVEAQLAEDIAAVRKEWGWKHVIVTPELATSIRETVGVRLVVKAAA